MKPLRIGTRGSPLALAQVEMTIAALQRVQPDIDVEVVKILTSGDWKPEHGEVPLKADAGGKALFAKEIERALLDGEIDVAVHSMKDMETALPDGLSIPYMLPREDARDVLICNEELAVNGCDLSTLPAGAVVGTTSVRRAAAALSVNPALKIVPLRGNVQTRIDKVRDGQCDATFLALAGLKRLGISMQGVRILEVKEMLPAAGQGAVGLEFCNENVMKMPVFSQINCFKTNLCVSAERAALHALNGSCHTPIAAHATLDNGEMHLRVAVYEPDGSAVYENHDCQPVQSFEEAWDLGYKIGAVLKPCLPAAILLG